MIDFNTVSINNVDVNISVDPPVSNIMNKGSIIYDGKNITYINGRFKDNVGSYNFS